MRCAVGSRVLGSALTLGSALLDGCAGYQPVPDESGHLHVECQDIETFCDLTAQRACSGNYTVLERVRIPWGPASGKPELGRDRASITMEVQCER
jgi:hypothetical protein